MHCNFISVFLFFSLCAFGSTLSIYDAFGFVPSVALSPWMNSMGMTRNETQSGAPQNLQEVIKSAFASQSAASFKAQPTGQGSMPPAVSPCCGPHCILDGCLAEIPQRVSKSVDGGSRGCCSDDSDCADSSEHCTEQDNVLPPIPNGGSGGSCSDERLCGPNEHCSEQAGVVAVVTSGTEGTALPSTTSNETSSEATPTTTDQPQHSTAGGTSGCCKDQKLCGPNQHCIADLVVAITSSDGTSSVVSQTTTCGPQKATEGGSGDCCEDESLCGPNQHCIDGQVVTFTTSLKPAHSTAGGTGGCCKDPSLCKPNQHCIGGQVVTFTTSLKPAHSTAGGTGGCCKDPSLCKPNQHCIGGQVVTFTTSLGPAHSTAGGTGGCCKDQSLCGPGEHCIGGQVVTFTTSLKPAHSTAGGTGGCCKDPSLCKPNQHCIGGQVVTFTTSLGPAHSTAAGGTGGCCKDQRLCGPGEHCIIQKVVTFTKDFDEMAAEAVQTSTAVVDSSSFDAAAAVSSPPIRQSATRSSQAEHPHSALRLPLIVEAANGAPVTVLAKMSPESAENLVTRQALRDLRRESDIGVGFRSAQYIALSVMAGAHHRIHLGQEFTIVDDGDADFSIGSTLLRNMGMLSVDSQGDHSSTPELKLQSP